MKKSPRAIIKGATTLALAPPLLVFLGVSVGAFQGWDIRPLLLGSAIWSTLALAFAGYALARLEHRPK